jgi:hypothetical protein
MATEPKPLISETLLHQIKETAQEQDREPAEVLEEAWTRYREEQCWAKLVTAGQENARHLGLKESDTERLIAEYRQEKRGR